MKTLIPILLGLAVLAGPSAAQFDPTPTRSETITFLKRHMPSAMTMLERVEKQEGEASFKAMINEAKLDLMDYREVLEYDGKERADLFLKELQLDYQIQDLVIQHIGAEDKPEKQKALQAELAKLSEAQRTNTIASLQLELEDMKHVVKTIEAEIEETIKGTPEQRVEYIMQMYAPSNLAYPPPLPDGWMLDLPKALVKGTSSKKSVVAVFSAGWCPPCQKMLKEVFPNPEVAKALEAYIPVYVDGDKFPKLCKSHSIRYYPTIIILDAEGGVVKKSVGATPAVGFAAWLTPSKHAVP